MSFTAGLLFLQAHIVNYNAAKYPSFADAVKADDGLAVLAVFIQVCYPCYECTHYYCELVLSITLKQGSPHRSYNMPTRELLT